MLHTFLFDHLLLTIGVLFVVGACSGWIAYSRSGSVWLSSAIFTFFFSFGLVVYRLAFPMPTLMMIVAMLEDAAKPEPALVCDSDGCYDPTDDAQGYILLPWLVQWVFWAMVFYLLRAVFSSKKKRQAAPP